MPDTPDQFTPVDVEYFHQGYIACALWAETDNSDESGGEPLSNNYDADDISPSHLTEMRESCRVFIAANIVNLLAAMQTPGYGWRQAGHDLWLTQNGHGAGYWGRGLGTPGDALSDAARAEGACELYVGDDGKLYFSTCA